MPAGSGGRPFIHHQLRQLRGQGVQPGRSLPGLSRRAGRGGVGDGSAFGLEVVYSFDGPELRGTAGAVQRASPCWARRSSCSTATHTSNAATRPSRSLRGRGQAGADDRLSQRGSVGHQQRRVSATAASWPMTRSTAPRPCSTSITVLGVWNRRAFEAVPEVGSVRSGRGLSGDARTGRTRGVRGHRTVLRDRLGERDSRRRDKYLAGRLLTAQNSETIMTHTAQFLSEAKQVIDGLNVETIERMACNPGTGTRTRRPAVHPGGRRQCGQCLTRRQRFP